MEKDFLEGVPTPQKNLTGVPPGEGGRCDGKIPTQSKMDARLDCLFEMRAQMWRKALNARVAATVAAHALVDARKAKAPAQELETLEAASSRANAAEVAAEEALRRAEEAL